MQFFKKYYLVLPPVALLYGIYVLNISYPKGDGIPQTMMNSLVNGWYLLWILFAALSAGIIYQLQENKKQQYIYSLPWTKKEIYRKSISGLHISLLIAEVIYAICFVIRTATIPRAETMDKIILCTLVNAIVCCAICAITQVTLTATVYVWQGLIIAVGMIYVMIPMIIQNLAFLINLLFGLTGRAAGILNWIIYYAYNRSFLYPLNYAVTYEQSELVYGSWKSYYESFSCICIIVLLLAGIFCFWYAKRKYTRGDQAQNRMLTRLSSIENKIILTIMIGMVGFNTVTNYVITDKVVYFDNESVIEKIFANLVMWNKSEFVTTDNYNKLIKLVNGSQIFIYFVVILAITYLAITLIQTIRRKHNERAC